MPDKVLDTIGGVLNPFPSQGVKFAPSMQELDPAQAKANREQLIAQAGKNLLGWTGVGLAMRFLLGGVSNIKTNKKMDKDLQSYVNARNPIISMDPDTNDKEVEDKERARGLEKAALAENPNLVEPPSFLSNLTQNIKGTFKTVGRKDRANMHLAATLVATFGGFSAGWMIADKLAARKKEMQLDKNIANGRNEMDKLLQEEYMRTRGLAPAASQDVELNKAAAEPDAGITNAAGALYTLWAVGTLALAYTASKNYMDKQDPNRARMSELKSIAKERAKMKDAPLLIEESSYRPENTEGALKPKKKRVATSVALPDTLQNMHASHEIAPQFDPRDPSAAALASAL